MRFLCGRRLRHPVVLAALLGVMGVALAIMSPLKTAPVQLHPQVNGSATPVASFSRLTDDAFDKLVREAFEQAGFSLKGTRDGPDGAKVRTFTLPVALSQGVRPVEVLVRTDGTVDRQHRCQACFLRLPVVEGLDGWDGQPLAKLPWLDQYTLNRALFPAIDQAYAQVRTAGQAWLSPDMPFRYQKRWQGELNLYDNAFAGVTLAALKSALTDAWSAAGFVLVGEEPAASGGTALVFSYPFAAGAAQGVVYKIGLFSQLDANGICQTCETQDQFDPYQTLPPAGLSGVLDRMTLQSRFSAARALAYDKFNQAAARYLRPNSVFTVPPEPAALGSPRPRPVAPVVT